MQCWDNSTRGLDSSTALKFVKTLRLATDLAGSCAIVAIYQASESIYDVLEPNDRWLYLLTEIRSSIKSSYYTRVVRSTSAMPMQPRPFSSIWASSARIGRLRETFLLL